MTDLTTIRDSSPAKITSLALPPELTARLDADGNLEDLVRDLAQDPRALAEAFACMDRIEKAALLPAGEDGVKAVVGKRFAIYPQPKRSEAEWDAWWQDYYNALSDKPLASLEAAMRAYIGDPDSEFLPKPGKLRELAFVTPTRAVRRLNIARLALAWEPPAEYREPTAAEIKAREDMEIDIKRLTQSAVSRLVGDDARTARPAGFKSKPAPVDGGGLTQQMRDLIARREATA